MNIRKAVKEDYNSISTIGLCVWLDTYAIEGVTKTISDYVIAEFCKSDNNSEKKIIYIAENNNHILGYIALSYNTQQYEIKNLYVLPKLQNNGIGKKLLKKVISNVDGRLWLSCWEKNASAIGFYKAMGFIEVGDSYFELGNEKHRNVIFELIGK